MKRRMSQALLIGVSIALFVVAALWQSVAGRVPSALGYTLPQGWNLIANPGGTLTSGPAYTWQANDTAYEVSPAGSPLAAGFGYWVYVPQLSGLPLPAGQTRPATIFAPAGQYVMIGDPSGILAANVTGADYLFTYDPRTGYHTVANNVLTPGQGAFAVSLAGGQIVLTAQGSTTAACSTADQGSACPVAGACPAGYPVAITQDAIAHPAPGAGTPPVQGSIVLCFNDISQATAAGYQTSSPFRIILPGPVTAITSDIKVTVLRAILETPDAFLARAKAGGEQLRPGVNMNGATAIVTVEYELENLDRPPTLVVPGNFRSDNPPGETASAVVILSSQHPADVVSTGAPTLGSISGGLVLAKFSDITEVDWQLIDPLCDTLVPSPHGPSITFELGFRGPLAPHILQVGNGNGPLPSYDANTPSPDTLGGCGASVTSTTTAAAATTSPTATPLATSSPTPSPSPTPATSATPAPGVSP